MLSVLPTSLSADSTPLFADVIVPRHLAGPFTYIVPASLQSTLRIGHQVLVPFGRSMLQGAVIALSPIPPHGFNPTRLKEIHAQLTQEASTDITATLFQLSRQVADQYVAPWGQCLRLVLRPTPKPCAPVHYYELTAEGRAALRVHEPCAAKTWTLLARLGKKPLALRRASRTTEPFYDLLARGWVQIQALPGSAATPLPRAGDLPSPAQPKITTTAPLAPSLLWATPLFHALTTPESTRILMEAPWSERLRVLQQTIRLVLERTQTVLIIVGETDRAEWVAGLLRDNTAGITPICFHSGLSEQMKVDVWDQIHRQIVRIVVGTRSAIFLPLTNLGVIWIEEEEDPALKEPQEPRYHARDVAWFRAEQSHSVLVLSSAHASLETKATGETHGIIIRQSHVLNESARIQVVNLRDHPRGAVLTQPLRDAIEQTLGRRARVLLFLNRKGYAGALVCRDCGQVPRCTACRVALTYSRHANRLRCSYCTNMASVPETCAGCSGPRMQWIGEGTERVEEEVHQYFPHATLLRLDGDTMRTPGQTHPRWRTIEEGKWDILVGTQLLLRHRPLPLLGLVGIVQADAGLSLPDFRSAERTYHTLLDAVSLTNSATADGQVIVQTYLSSHHAIQAVAQQDASLFISEELSHRRTLGYPPAVSLIALLVSGANEKLVSDAAAAWVAQLNAYTPSATGATAARPQPLGLTVLGPIPSPVPQLRGQYRWQILVKSLERKAGLDAVGVTVKEMERTHQRRNIKFNVNVDPIDMW